MYRSQAPDQKLVMWLDLHLQVVYPVILVLYENMQNQEVRKKNTEITEGVRPSVEVPDLTRANLRRLKGKDPVAAALASIVSSLPPSETTYSKWPMPRSRPGEEEQ